MDSIGDAVGVLLAPLGYVLTELEKVLPKAKVDAAVQTARQRVVEMPGLHLAPASASIVRLAGLSGAVAVCLGAYGSHVLRELPDVEQRRKFAFDTGSRYHLIHSAVLLAAPLCRRPILTAALLLGGMGLFSGTCYHYALTGRETARRFTPFGGVLLILAWLSMIL